jgi:hypothetical protein
MEQHSHTDECSYGGAHQWEMVMDIEQKTTTQDSDGNLVLSCPFHYECIKCMVPKPADSASVCICTGQPTMACPVHGQGLPSTVSDVTNE